jgi:hypothetical protein
MKNIVHLKENNIHSQRILNAERGRLNKVCRKVHEALLKGKKLSGLNFTQEIGALEYRKRFDELIQAGYPVQSKFIGGGLKEWFYTDSYINDISNY